MCDDHSSPRFPHSVVGYSTEDKRLLGKIRRLVVDGLAYGSLSLGEDLRISEAEGEEAVGGDDARAVADASATAHVANARRVARIGPPTEAYYEDLLRSGSIFAQF